MIREPDGPFRQREWVTRMARLAATEHGADWVINGDVDEFWWPRGGSLPDVLGSIPRRYGLVQSFVRHFVPVPDDGRSFEERMTLRLASQAPINDPRSPWRPFRKVVHRAHPDAEVVEGSHSVGGTGLVPMRGWYPLEVLHFPIRTSAQLERKGALWGSAVEKFYASEEVVAGPRCGLPRAGVRGQRARTERRGLRGPRGNGCRAGACGRGRRAGRGHEDPGCAPGDRLGRRPPAFPRATAADDASFAVDAAVLGEADLVRVRRRLDELGQRVAALESRPAVRLERGLRSLARRARRDG